MHGQYDWTRDPALSSKRFDWDTACPGDQWRHSHNYEHHTFTNIVGKDRDVGYAILRISPEQRWTPVALGNPLYAALLALIFEHGVMLHDVEVERVMSGEKTWADAWPTLRAGLRKSAAQAAQGLRHLAAGHRTVGSADRGGQRHRQRGPQPLGVHDHLLRPLPRRDPRVHHRGGRRREPGPLVFPAAAGVGQHHRAARCSTSCPAT